MLKFTAQTDYGAMIVECQPSEFPAHLEFLKSVGYDPGTKTEIGTVSHVARRNKREDDGSITPHIAFYHEHEKMVYRWVGLYLNTDDQRNTFERFAGLPLRDVPVYPGKGHPEKDETDFVVSLPQPIRIQRTLEDGEYNGEKTTFKKFAGYVGQPAQNGSVDHAPPPGDMDDIPF